MLSGFKTTPQFKIPRIRYLGKWTDFIDRSVYTQEVNFGAAQKNKEFFILVQTTDSDSSGSRNISVTMKGHPATDHGGVGSASRTQCLSAAVPEGGLGDIVATIAGSNPNATTYSFYLYEVLDRFKANEAVRSTDLKTVSNSNAPSGTITIPAWGFGFLSDLRINAASSQVGSFSGGWTKDNDTEFDTGIRNLCGHIGPVEQAGAYPCTVTNASGGPDHLFGMWAFR